MTKLSDNAVEDVVQYARRKISDIIMKAAGQSGDAEQRFQIVATLAASTFGTAGAAFQDFNPASKKEEAARAVLAHIGSLVGAYSN